MTTAAFERAFATRNSAQDDYVSPNNGGQVWDAITEHVANRDKLTNGVEVRDPVGEALGLSSVGGSTGGGLLSLDPGGPSEFMDFQSRLPQPAALPDNFAERAGPSPFGEDTLGLDVRGIDRALGSIDTGPQLEDFGRHGTLPGFGDPNEDPYGVELRQRLTALLRSAG